MVIYVNVGTIAVAARNSHFHPFNYHVEINILVNFRTGHSILVEKAERPAHTENRMAGSCLTEWICKLMDEMPQSRGKRV